MILQDWDFPHSIGSLGTNGQSGQIRGISPPSFLFLPGRARATCFEFINLMGLAASVFNGSGL